MCPWLEGPGSVAFPAGQGMEGAAAAEELEWMGTAVRSQKPPPALPPATSTDSSILNTSPRAQWDVSARPAPGNTLAF